MSALLLDERVVAVQPALVRLVGSVTVAAVLQQLHFHASRGEATEHDGHGWVVLTYAELADELGLTTEQVRRAVGKLERRGLVVTCQPEGYQRRKWYRIDHDHADLSKWRNGHFQSAEPPDRSGGNADTPLSDSREKTAVAREVDQVFDAWVASTEKGRAVLDAKRRGLIHARLREFPVGDLIAAVDGWKHSPFHAGKNDRRKVYNDLGLLLRDAAHVEQFRDAARGNGQAPRHDPRGLNAHLNDAQ